jgi:hypothetical protein
MLSAIQVKSRIPRWQDRSWANRLYASDNLVASCLLRYAERFVIE